MKRFNTCFFERYAQITLETILGDNYADLVNKDRPDLQKPDGSMGIEVTRAMQPQKEDALDMIKEMAGLQIEEKDREEVNQIINSGYGYGLQDGKYIGHLEYEYWSLALPLRRIIESKVRKVASGFYSDFKEFGLYIFCKDDLSDEEVIKTIEYTSELQRNLDIRYSKLYISLINKLYVSDLSEVNRIDHPTNCTSYDISNKMCKEFFTKALEK